LVSGYFDVNLDGISVTRTDTEGLSMRNFRWLIVLAGPLTLIMFAVRLFTLSWYPAFEYSRPNFPDDPLGMPDAERLRLARVCIKFLNVPHDTNLLASLRFQDGSVVFTDRELDHMDDVKRVYDRMTTAVAIIFVLAFVIALVLIRKGHSIDVYRSIYQGSWLSIALLVMIGLWMLVGFNAFFTAFHGIFFSEGTWLFYSTDALIRLFPLQFWQDAGIGIAVFVIIISLMLIVFGWGKVKRIQTDE
jgi:integral membrane protein (TIGR01906 family)